MNATCVRCGYANRETASFCANCGQPLPAATATGALASHSLLNGRYEVLEVAGRGAMGAVYRAHDFQADRLVAVKEMSDAALGPGQRAAAAEQFHREALLLQALNHPHLVKVYDVFTEGRRHYLVMDYIEGRTLAETVGPGGRAGEEDVRAWALQLCDVLAYLHGRQPPVILRDLKPENVMVTQAGDRLVLVDFGIARLFDPGKERDTIAIGTRGFMAPEAFHGQTDARSDLYSLGVTLHVLLTGTDPAAHAWKLPPVGELAPEVSEELAEIVAHAIELDPEARFQTAGEFKRALGGEVASPDAAPAAAAPAAPAAARVSTARPVRFNGRFQVTSLDQLVALCDNHPEAGVNHLRAGELEVWLEHLGERELAAEAREMRQQAGADLGVQLEALLQATRRAPPPQLTVSPPALELGAVSNQVPHDARVRVRNAGRGLLAGQVYAETGWLAVGRPTFAGNDVVIPITVHAQLLPPDAPATGRLLVRTNGGQAEVPVRLLPTRRGRTAAVAQPPRWAAGILLVLAVVGGGWIVQQLAGRWPQLASFDMTTWAAHPRAALILPLAALCLTLAAMLGSLAQWERLVADAPLSEWAHNALWALGLTFVALGVSAAALSFGVPSLAKLAPAPADVGQRLLRILPVAAGAAIAAAAVTGGTARRLRNAGSATLVVALLLGWVLAILAGAAGGFVAGDLIGDLLKRTLSVDLRWTLALAGAALAGGLGFLAGRSALSARR